MEAEAKEERVARMAKRRARRLLKLANMMMELCVVLLYNLFGISMFWNDDARTQC